MNIDPLHIVLAIVSVAVWWLRTKGVTLPTPGPDGTIALPDLLPGNPLLNSLLKTILRKLLSGEPLLAGESALARQHRASLSQHVPGIDALIDRLKDGKTPAPAAPP